MEHFWLKRSMMNEVPEVAGLLIRLNLKRSWVAIAVIILIQLVSTISGVIQVYPNYVLGNILVGVWCVLFALYMLIFYQNHLDENEKIARWCCIVFWAVLGMVMIPFHMGDIKMTSIPVSMITLYALLLVGPFFMAKEALAVHGINYLSYLVAFFMMGGPGMQLLFVTMLSSAIFFLCQQSQSQYVQQMIHIKKQANYDFLTGLMTRQSGMEKMKRIYDRCRYKNWMMGILMVDIDYFKNYNDHFGHVQGDDALRKVGQCLNACFNRPEDMVCRLGGEEFLICFSCEDKAAIMENGKRIYDEVKRLNIMSHDGDNLTVSIGGMGILPAKTDESPDLMCLVDACDKLLYQAKHKGKNQVVYDSALTA